MEITGRRKNSSGDKFSFPIIPIQDEFEFSSTSPSSPNSPADHLFHNGRLLPHTFPSQPTSNTSTIYSRSTSRASSVSSRDSLLSSRSNSSNSRSSSCSSARTSTSEASEQRKLSKIGELGQRRQINRGTQQFGGSKRWQFIAPSPVLSQEVSRRRRRRRQGGRAVGELRLKKTGDGSGGGEEKKKRRKKGWFGRRFIRWFVSACRECHAIEPTRRKGGVLDGKILEL